MKRLVVVGLLAVVVGGGAYFFTNYRLEIHRGQDGIESVSVRPRSDLAGSGQDADPAYPGAERPPIRIATFQLGGLDARRLEDPQTATLLTDVIGRFDVVAVQAIRDEGRAVVLRLVDQVNADGRQYDFVTAESQSVDPRGQISAVLFDRQTIEVDRSTVRTVADPNGRFRHRPLVALFRVKGPDPTSAFTFSLLCVQTDPDRTTEEQDLLGDIYRAVRDSQPDEDDVILLGELGPAADGTGSLAGLPEITCSISDIPTTLSGTRPQDNILFDRRATSEFTGRSGVLDLMRDFDLTWREASGVSEHLPVWAEFSPNEGGYTAHMAGRTSPIAPQ